MDEREAPNYTGMQFCQTCGRPVSAPLDRSDDLPRCTEPEGVACIERKARLHELADRVRRPGYYRKQGRQSG